MWSFGTPFLSHFLKATLPLKPATIALKTGHLFFYFYTVQNGLFPNHLRQTANREMGKCFFFVFFCAELRIFVWFPKSFRNLWFLVFFEGVG